MNLKDCISESVVEARLEQGPSHAFSPGRQQVVKAQCVKVHHLLEALGKASPGNEIF